MLSLHIINIHVLLTFVFGPSGDINYQQLSSLRLTSGLSFLPLSRWFCLVSSASVFNHQLLLSSPLFFFPCRFHCSHLDALVDKKKWLKQVWLCSSWFLSAWFQSQQLLLGTSPLDTWLEKCCRSISCKMTLTSFHKAGININSNNKRRIQDFLQSPHCTTKRLQHVHSCGLGAIVCKSHRALIIYVQHAVLYATWCEGTAQLLSLTEFKLHLSELNFIGWSIYPWGRGGNRSTHRKPLVTSFRKCHILKPEDSSPKWGSNPHNSIGGRLGKQTC